MKDEKPRKELESYRRECAFLREYVLAVEECRSMDANSAWADAENERLERAGKCGIAHGSPRRIEDRARGDALAAEEKL